MEKALLKIPLNPPLQKGDFEEMLLYKRGILWRCFFIKGDFVEIFLYKRATS